ncbi:C6 transcription factor [Cordyceps militaris]|uniref:C6 transcription factor n=1 Tax=Cordyceps militaris TaxID=73501 RepID=A0A2H4SQF4_CORMI|nr:C6 transcription factor [Cordyceps militaris]
MLDSAPPPPPPPSRPLQPKTTRGQERSAPEYPSIKRRRATVIACHNCRLKKIRCDGQRPACSSCASKTVPCTYRDAVRDAVPGVVRMLGQLCASELVRVVARLKDEEDAETILATIKACLARQARRRHDEETPSTAGSEECALRTPLAGGDVDWYWPASCHPTTTTTTTMTTTTAEFAVHTDVVGPVVDYWPNGWPRTWARFPNDI